jgi:hypothetical protein
MHFKRAMKGCQIGMHACMACLLNALSQVIKLGEPAHEHGQNINNTMVYTQLISFESNEYHVKTAKTIGEACKLAKAGLEHFTSIEGVPVFRKRK